MKASFWDRVVPKIEDDTGVNEIFFKAIKKQVMIEDKLLEIGAGTGNMSRALAEEVSFVEGSDFSTKMIERANSKEAIKNSHFSIQDATKLTFESNSFDVVLAINTLHVVSDIEIVLQEINRVLCDKGKFVAIIPLLKRDKMKFMFVKSLMKLMKFRLWSMDEYKCLFESQGFEITYQEEFQGKSQSVILVGKKL